MLSSIRALAGHFGRVRSDSTSLENCRGINVFLPDCCMVSLNLFVCGKCRLVAVSVGEHVSFLWKRFFDFLVCFEL